MVTPNVIQYAVVKSKPRLSNPVKWSIFVVIMLLSAGIIYLPMCIFWIFPWLFDARSYGTFWFFALCPYEMLVRHYYIYKYSRFETWMYSFVYVNLAFYLLYGLVAGGTLWYRALRWVFGACIIFHFLMVLIAYAIRD